MSEVLEVMAKAADAAERCGEPTLWDEFFCDKHKAAKREHMLEALRAAERAGYVLVPIEPTKAMLHAAAKAMSPGRRPTPARVSVSQKHAIRWRAMVDARPRGPSNAAAEKDKL